MDKRHQVLFVTQQWSAAEVIEYWHRLFKGSLISQRYACGGNLSRAERDALTELLGSE